MRAGRPSPQSSSIGIDEKPSQFQTDSDRHVSGLADEFDSSANLKDRADSSSYAGVATQSNP